MTKEHLVAPVAVDVRHGRLGRVLGRPRVDIERAGVREDAVVAPAGALLEDVAVVEDALLDERRGDADHREGDKACLPAAHNFVARLAVKLHSAVTCTRENN